MQKRFIKSEIHMVNNKKCGTMSNDFFVQKNASRAKG